MNIIQRVRAAMDGWANPKTGLGGARSRSAWTYYQGRPALANEELEQLYGENALAARIVDRLADDATREPFRLKGTDAEFGVGELESKIEDLRLLQTLGDAIRWSRLYGGAIVIGDDLGKPERPRGESPVVSLRVVEAASALPVLTRGTIAEVLHPELYRIDLGDGETFVVHSSKVWRFDGVRVSARMLLRSHGTNPGWGPSVLQRVYESLMRVGESRGYSAELLHVLSVPGIRIKGLKDILRGKDGHAMAREMVRAIRETMDMLGLLAIDSDDEAFVSQRNASGAVELHDAAQRGLVADTDMPSEILQGVTPGGLNTGESAGPIRQWYDHVDAYRRNQLTPIVSSIVAALPIDDLPEEWTIEWDPLWQPDPKEVADNYKTTAEADAIYVGTVGALAPEEVRRARFVEGTPGPIELPEEQVEELSLPEPPDAPHEPAALPDIKDEALAPGHIASLLEIAKAVRAKEITADDAVGILALAFPMFSPTRLIASLAVESPGTGTAEPSSPTDDTEPEPSPHAPPDDLLSPREIGEKLGVSAASVKAMHKRREIDGWMIGGRWRFSLAQVYEATHQPRHTEHEEPDATDR